MRDVRFRSSIVSAFAVAVVLAAGACNQPSGGGSSSGAASSGGNLTVDAVCSAFCTKLCATCGDSACKTTCKPPCYHGRDPSMVMDGHDPKVALAWTQATLDGCLATINGASCPGIMSGQAVPPACYTIQH